MFQIRVLMWLVDIHDYRLQVQAALILIPVVPVCQAVRRTQVIQKQVSEYIVVIFFQTGNVN